MNSPIEAVTVGERPTEPAKLFRNEVMLEQQTMWLGTVVLAPRRSHSAMAVFALGMIGLLALLMGAHYTRTVRVAGLLVPNPGMVRVFAPQAGVLVQVAVREGDQVKQGDRLLTLSAELQTEAQGDTREMIVRRLQSRRDSLQAVRAGQLKLQARQADSMRKRIASVESAISHLEQELGLTRARQALAGQVIERQEKLFSLRVGSIQSVEQARDLAIQLASQQQALNRQKATLDQERIGLLADLADLPLKNAAELGETERAVSTLEQEIAETEARRQIVVTAPQDGTVSAIQAEIGSTAQIALPLLSIIPAASILQAELFAPSRAVGFITPGQKVQLRYEAFPYQKFGRYEGIVDRVSRASISASELPQQLAGLNTLYESTAPIYRIAVKLERQAANVYGRAVPLQPGMQLEADLVVETRRLIEWVFDPLYTLTGRLLN